MGEAPIWQTIHVHITGETLHKSYNDLTERARINLDFILLTAAAAVICALGFKMNSASVIVGAMVISPLLYPVICLGAATYKTDRRSFLRALRTLVAGCVTAIFAAAVVNFIYATTFQSEIVSRLSAAATDYVLVAFFSGVAGTYAFFSPKMHEAIAGIAISVALVPPVVMLGIATAEENYILFISSGIIVLYNVFGIYVGSITMTASLHWISKIQSTNW
jgi:uncharacterized hydrophobic protein (TIGR00271 family)